MKLENGYKVIYEVISRNADDETVRTFKASKTGVFADAEVIDSVVAGTYKLIYQNANGEICGSVTGIPAEDDYVFTSFNAVIAEKEVEAEEVELPVEPENTVDEPEVVTPAESEEIPVEDNSEEV